MLYSSIGMLSYITKGKACCFAVRNVSVSAYVSATLVTELSDE